MNILYKKNNQTMKKFLFIKKVIYPAFPYICSVLDGCGGSNTEESGEVPDPVWLFIFNTFPPPVEV